MAATAFHKRAGQHFAEPSETPDELTAQPQIGIGSHKDSDKRSCGRPNCHCADGKSLHTQYQISVLIDGQPKTFHVPKSMVDQVREMIQLRQRFEEAAAAICKINLRRFLKEKEKS